MTPAVTSGIEERGGGSTKLVVCAAVATAFVIVWYIWSSMGRRVPVVPDWHPTTARATRAAPVAMHSTELPRSCGLRAMSGVSAIGARLSRGYVKKSLRCTSGVVWGCG